MVSLVFAKKEPSVQKPSSGGLLSSSVFSKMYSEAAATASKASVGGILGRLGPKPSKKPETAGEGSGGTEGGGLLMSLSAPFGNVLI